MIVHNLNDQLVDAARLGENIELVNLLAYAMKHQLTPNLNEALSWAARLGHVQTVMILVNSGAEVDCEDFRGNDPLHWAAYSSQEQRIKKSLVTTM